MLGGSVWYKYAYFMIYVLRKVISILLNALSTETPVWVKCKEAIKESEIF